MPEMSAIGRVLLVLGGVLIVLGLVFICGSKLPFLGRLPGDIRIEGRNVSCFFPLATMVLLSLLLTVLLNVLTRLFRK